MLYVFQMYRGKMVVSGSLRVLKNARQGEFGSRKIWQVEWLSGKKKYVESRYDNMERKSYVCVEGVDVECVVPGKDDSRDEW